MDQNAPVLIADIEARIEQLNEQRERAGKAIVLARLALWGGALLLLAVFAGLFVLNRVEISVAALALAIGGFVVAGSSRATVQELDAGIEKLEAARSEAIDQLDLEFVRTDAPHLRVIH